MWNATPITHKLITIAIITLLLIQIAMLNQWASDPWRMSLRGRVEDDIRAKDDQ
jgi:hypothetical protein